MTTDTHPLTDDEALRPWRVDLADFPPDAGTSELFRFAVKYGILAPSPHNTQPWLFQVYGAGLDVIGDTRRGLPVTDPHDRELVMSCGAVVENLTLVLRRLGYDSNVDVLPDARDPELYVRITLSGDVEPPSDDVTLFDQIPRRRTNRAAYERRPLPDELVKRLRSDSASRGASLVVIRPDQVDDVADLVMAADHVQMADQRFRRELAAWLTHRRRRDGMPKFAVETGRLRVPSAMTPLIARTFDLGSGKAGWDRQLIKRSGQLVAITTTGDDVQNWLAAGRALQAVLLRARAHDVWASFLDQPIEVEELRPRLAAVVDPTKGGSSPQVLLRLGYGPEPAPTHRRDADDFFVE